ncbi:unnamed protein product [Staurois parvus]|uniref:Uncharacterized protein n=1 Tax=Staurois parvus TaxID=386267 RepID=A0ABN9D6T1_9NEOB|nr:unnamed protein product [Staurois parvus]
MTFPPYSGLKHCMGVNVPELSEIRLFMTVLDCPSIQCFNRCMEGQSQNCH